MLNKIKKEYVFIFLFLAGTLFFFDAAGINYTGITGAQIADTNINAVQDAFETIFRILFEGFAKPLFDVFHIPVTGIVAIRIVFALLLFAILFPIMGSMRIFGGERNRPSRNGGIIAGLISLISAAFIPENILELYFGNGYVNVFSSLLGFVFVIGTSILLMYGASRISGQDPQNNRARSLASGIGYLVSLFIILFVVEVAKKQIVTGLQTVFAITWAVLVLVCMVQFIRYTIYYPLSGLDLGAAPGGAATPRAIEHRGDLRDVLRRHLQEQRRMLNILGTNLTNQAIVEREVLSIRSNIGTEHGMVNSVRNAVLDIMNPADRVRTETAINRIGSINGDIQTILGRLQVDYATMTPAQRNTAYNDALHLFQHKQQEVSRI